MRTLVLVAALLAAVPLAAQTDARIAEGIALHDAGKYEEAIAKYKAVLAENPNDLLARYELALTYQTTGAYAQCIDIIEPFASQPTRLQPAVLTTLANCLDGAGQTDRAIATYRKGLALAPNDPGLLYNLAVTLTGRKQYADARELLKKELAIRPAHGSGHYLLGQVFEEEGFRAAAILSYLRFLAIEPAGERAKDAATRALALLGAGVTQEDTKNVKITIDPESRTDEGDFKGWEMMMAIAAAARFTEENETLSEFEQARQLITIALRMLIETRADLGGNYSTANNLPFFVELEAKKLLDTYAGIALSSVEFAGAEEWSKKNAAEVESFRALMRERAK